MREADEPSRGRVVRPMPETGPGTGQADVPEMRQVPVPRGRGHVRQVPGAPCVAILFSLRRAAAEGLAGRVVRPMPAAPFGEGEDMNPMDVAWRPCTCWVWCCAARSCHVRRARARVWVRVAPVCSCWRWRWRRCRRGWVRSRSGSCGARRSRLAGVRPDRSSTGGPVPRMGPAARRRRGSRPGLPVTRTAGHSFRSCSCSTSKRILSRVRPRRAWRAIRLCLPFPPSGRVACVASPRTDAGKKISCGRHDAQERQRHKAADGEQRHQIVVPGGGQVQDDFEDVEHGLDQVSDVFHVPWYAFAGHVYARSRFW